MVDTLAVIRLAGVPQGKGRPRFVRQTGRTYTPEKTRSYEGALRYQAQEVMGMEPPFDGQLAVHVRADMPIPKGFSKAKRAAAIAGDIRPTTKPDCDNIIKNLDALNQVVFVDDKQIVDVTISKWFSERPALTIEVSGA